MPLPKFQPIRIKGKMPCADPRFTGFLPDDKILKLVAANSGNLLYRDENGTEYLVPHIWYNLPLSILAEQMQQDYKRQCEKRDDLRKHPERLSWYGYTNPRWLQHELNNMRRRAAAVRLKLWQLLRETRNARPATA